MDLLTSSEALQHCSLLSNHIDEAIKKNGGWISFANYMNLALYTPSLGYYTGGLYKLGAKGDFITAPEISSLFGASIAQTLYPIIEYFAKKNEDSQVLEFGAGSGKLCQDILSTFHAKGLLPSKYLILEISPELIARQKERLQRFITANQIPVEIEWVSDIPADFTGIILANEVLDAIPFELVIKQDSHWYFLGVSMNPQPSSPSFSDHWLYTKGSPVPLDDLPKFLQEHSDSLPDGYMTEIHPQSLGWIKHIGQQLKQGIFFTIDYGFPEQEFYHPQRVQGTHIAHHRHQSIPDMFYLPGLCDLTSHVEWTTINRVAKENHLSLIYFQSQGSYLLQAGIGELFMQTIDSSDAKAYTKAASDLQKLISEAEMGELFKVAAWSRNTGNDSEFDLICSELPGFTGRQRLLEV
jgi:SAM-dependent MidA family methyltransferase